MGTGAFGDLDMDVWIILKCDLKEKVLSLWM
jgi:hypothetical protein